MDNLAPYAALKFAKPGDVLMVATDDGDTASVLGDILLGMARNVGIVGAVTDGLVRDIEGINQVGIPTFARGLSPNSPFKDGPGEVGFPITLGGVRVASGDLVVGDIDGVVIVPHIEIMSAAAELKAVAEKEGQMEALVKSGSKYPPWLDESLSSPRVRFED